MKSSHDTLSRSDDTEEDERGSLPAHALHGGAVVRRTVEHVAVPMPPSNGERPPIVPLPVTIFSRKLEGNPLETEKPSEEVDDEDDDEEQEERPRVRRPVTLPPLPVIPKAEALERSELPTAEQLEKTNHEHTAGILSEETLALASSDDEEQPTAKPASQQAERSDQAPPKQPDRTEQYAWPAVDQDEAAPLSAAETPNHMPPMPTIRAASVPPASTPGSRFNFNNSPPSPPAPPAAPGSGPPGPPSQPPVPPSVGGNNMPPQPNIPSFNPSIAPGASFNQAPIPAASFNPNAYQAARPNVIIDQRPDTPARVLAGVALVGGWLGRRKLRKQMDANQKTNERQFATLQAEQQQAALTGRQQANELQKMRMAADQPRPLTSNFVGAPSPANKVDQRPAALPPIPGTAVSHEQRPVPPSPVQAQRFIEQSQLEQAAELHSEQHVTQSAWHKIVTEKGQPLEGQEYGRGFQMARKEVVPDRQTDRTAAGIAAVGATIQPSSTSQTQPQYGSPPYSGAGALPSGITTPSLPQGMPAHVDPGHQLAAKNKTDSPIPGPIFWIMLLVIIGAFFAAALI